jgi:O-antigen biosynthesis protein WbqP
MEDGAEMRAMHFTARCKTITPDEAAEICRSSSVPPAVANDLQINARRGYAVIKRLFDVLVSTGSLVAFSGVIVAVAVAVKVSSPGPVLFRQKRIGRHKELFDIYKFRTMRIDTPDLPSHCIDANEWMTPVGSFLRKYSIDELPQLWNILMGEMSLVGPRPALWSQCDLIVERDKYGANNVPPGLTGWAQINGRDELSIEEKAALDGEYVRRRGILFDLRCLLGTFSKLSGEGVVESVGTSSGEQGR